MVGARYVGDKGTNASRQWLFNLVIFVPYTVTLKQQVCCPQCQCTYTGIGHVPPPSARGAP